MPRLRVPLFEILAAHFNFDYTSNPILFGLGGKFRELETDNAFG